ncbi:MAG TPA: PilZ domain-containing protein [Vicinamibacterales bacterium]|nr:PilZ domain-containing protein [Vicinamibacterales bacterium]
MSIVLIAEPDQLSVLKGRSEYSDAQAFTDAETPAALEAIMTGRPDIVAIERIFAKKSRGAALINRIKADTSLETVEIRIVSAESGASKSSGRGGSAAVPAAGPSGAAATAAAVATPPAALDQKGTRRAPRFRIIEGIEVLIDGNPAMLVDLSTVGAQVVSGTLLKPNQRVRLSFTEGAKPVRFSAGVAWSAFELPKAGPRYRAGIEFFDADPDAVGRFCDTNRAEDSKRN